MQINYMLFFLKKKKKRQIIWHALVDKIITSRMKEVHRGVCLCIYPDFFFLIQLGTVRPLRILSTGSLTDADKQAEVHREVTSLIRAEENDPWGKTEWVRLVYLEEGKLRAKCWAFQIYIFYQGIISETFLPNVHVFFVLWEHSIMTFYTAYVG